MRKTILAMSFVFAAMLFVNSVSAAALIEATFSTSPATVAPGSDGYLQLALKNSGTTGAASIKVTQISYGNYVSVDTSGIGNLGSLGAGNTATYLFKFSVASTAPSGIYPVRFTIEYCTETSCAGETNPTAIINVQSPSTLQITSVEPNSLAAGETTSLKFNLANNGVDAINNIILSWQMPSNEILPLGSSNRQLISSLNGGAAITVPMNVSVSSSVTPGIYPLAVSVQYYDKSGTKQNFTSTIGIKIGGTTDFDVAVQDSSSGTTSLSIANIGVNPATSVSVRIPDQQDFAVTGASSSFLGTLNAGDFGVASFQISSRLFANRSSQNGATLPAAKNLLVEISYSDTSGMRQIVEKQVSLTLGTSTTTGTRSSGIFSGTIVYVIVAAAVIIVVLVWFFKFRKKKK